MLHLFWRAFWLIAVGAVQYEKYDQFLNDDASFYPKLLQATQQAVDNYSKFKQAFEDQQVRMTGCSPILVRFHILLRFSICCGS